MSNFKISTSLLMFVFVSDFWCLRSDAIFGYIMNCLIGGRRSMPSPIQTSGERAERMLWQQLEYEEQINTHVTSSLCNENDRQPKWTYCFKAISDVNRELNNFAVDLYADWDAATKCVNKNFAIKKSKSWFSKRKTGTKAMLKCFIVNGLTQARGEIWLMDGVNDQFVYIWGIINGKFNLLAHSSLTTYNQEGYDAVCYMMSPSRLTS